jgi:hypothetical protein
MKALSRNVAPPLKVLHAHSAYLTIGACRGMSTKNVGWRDAGIRGFVAAALLLASAAMPEHPLIALGLGFIGIVVIGTALYRVCPLYTLFRFNTDSSSAARPS